MAIVTEENPDASYDERKAAALEHVSEMSEEQVLVKSADVISNMTELMHDYAESGESVFDRFNTRKGKKLAVQKNLIQALQSRHQGNPLNEDLSYVLKWIEQQST